MLIISTIPGSSTDAPGIYELFGFHPYEEWYVKLIQVDEEVICVKNIIVIKKLRLLGYFRLAFYLAQKYGAISFASYNYIITYDDSYNWK